MEGSPRRAAPRRRSIASHTIHSGGQPARRSGARRSVAEAVEEAGGRRRTIAKIKM